MSDCALSSFSNVIAFRPVRSAGFALCSPSARCNRLTMRDRMDLLRWRQHARGFARVELAEDPDPEIGDFLMIYRPGRCWAAWGVGYAGGRLCVWETSTSRTVGTYDALSEALRAVDAANGRTVVAPVSDIRVALPIR